MAGESRFVTILFSDLSGLTGLPDPPGGDEDAGLSDTLFRRLRTLIEAVGGTAEKSGDDAVVAVFGAPVAHEDDPLRAVRAGMALQREVSAINAERGADLKLRVGIHAGEIRWGAGPPTGDAVAAAMRLEAAARSGSVLVSRAIQRSASWRVRFRPIGSVSLAGREEDIETFEAIEEIAGMTEYRLAGASATPLVGREPELARLAVCFTESRGACLLLEGEAGIGKSRLLAEFRRRMRLGGEPVDVMVGRTLEDLRSPLGPFADLVRSASGISGQSAQDSAAFTRWIVEALVRLQPTPAEREATARRIALSLGFPVASAPAPAPDDIHHAWSQWLRARAASRPLILCIEDLHLADDASLALLEFLASRSLTHFSIFATARPGILPAGFERLRIEELSSPATASLASDVLKRPVSEEAAAFLFERTGGHPLFVEEMVRHLEERGLLDGVPARVVEEGRDVPRGLPELLARRLEVLDAGEREALGSASVLGRVFWLNLLEGMTGGNVQAAVRSAAKKHLVAPQPGSMLGGDVEYAFRHALVRDAAYARVGAADRARLHAAAADLLLRRLPQGGRRVKAMAAGHRLKAGDADAAVALWVELAREAEGAGSPAEAAAHARAAERAKSGVIEHRKPERGHQDGQRYRG